MATVYKMNVENDFSGNSFKYTTTLDGVNYNIFVDYNRRIDTWFLTISTTDGQAMYQQLPLLQGVSPMVRLFSDVRVLEWGDIQIVDLNGDKLDPGILNFGIDKLLVYSSVGGD